MKLLMKTLKKLGLEENSLVIFTSDNCAAITNYHGYKSKLSVRGAKGTSWEGGHHVPDIFFWTGKVPDKIICNETAIKKLQQIQF